MINEIAEATSSEAELFQQQVQENSRASIGATAMGDHVYSLNESLGSLPRTSRSLQSLTTYRSPHQAPQQVAQMRFGYEAEFPPPSNLYPQNIDTSSSKAVEVQSHQSPRPSGVATYSSAGSTGVQIAGQFATQGGGYFGEMMIGCNNKLYERPTYTYEELAIMALENLPSNKGSVADIHEVIQNHFPYFKTKPTKTWKSSLRHSISKSLYMQKVSDIAAEEDKHTSQEQPKDRGEFPFAAGGDAASTLHPSYHQTSLSMASTSPRPQKRQRLSKVPVMWELYEPTEDECVARKKPIRRGFLQKELNKRSSASSAEIAKKPPPVVRLPVPAIYSCFPDPDRKKIDYNPNRALLPPPPYSQPQIIYGTPVAPEMYPFVTSLLDLSQDKRQVTTEQYGHSSHLQAGTKETIAQQNINTSSTNSHVQKQLFKGQTTQLQQLRPKPPVSLTSVAPLGKPSASVKSCTESYISNHRVTVSAPGQIAATASPCTIAPKSTFTKQCLPKVPPLIPKEQTMPSTSVPETGTDSKPCLPMYTCNTMGANIMQHNLYTHPWPASTHAMGSPTLTNPNHLFQFQQNRFPVPQMMPTNMSSYQVDDKQPTSWKVQDGYLVQSQGPSPASSSVMPNVTDTNNYNYDSAKFAPYYPWQVAQPLQYPHMPYQVPPLQSQRFSGMYTNPYEVSSSTTCTSTATGNHPMIPSAHSTYPHPYLTEFLEPVRHLTSTPSSTPSLIDSVITRDSGLDSLSPEGSGRDMLSRPGSEDFNP